MITPWQEFSGKEVSLFAAAIDQHLNSSTKAEFHCKTQFESRFLSLFNGNRPDRNGLDRTGLDKKELDGIDVFNREDINLLCSARNLDRIFTLPNDHSNGLYFFGAQGDSVSANGAADSAIAAIRSCLGEALERWIHKNTSLANEKSANARNYPFSTPTDTHLRWFADQQGCDETHYKNATEWVAAKSLVSDNVLLVPTDFAFRSNKSTADLFPSETSGLSTGPDTSSAISSALLELVERDTVALWWYGGGSASQLNLEPESSFNLISYANLARRNSTRPFWLVNIENEFQIPVIAAFSADRNGQQVIAGFSANTDIYRACCSAICELGQMELGLHLVQLKIKEQGIQGLNENDYRQINRAQQLSLASYPELYPPLSTNAVTSQSGVSGELQMNVLLDRITKAGYAPFAIDMTDTNIGVPCYRAVIPGLESCSINRASTRLKNRLGQLKTTINNVRAKPALL